MAHWRTDGGNVAASGRGAVVIGIRFVQEGRRGEPPCARTGGGGGRVRKKEKRRFREGGED